PPPPPRGAHPPKPTTTRRVTGGAPGPRPRLQRWTDPFVAHGADTFTAQRRGLAMLYQDAVGQAQVLAYVDDFWLLAVLFTLIPLFLPLMRRVSAERPEAPKADEAADSGRGPPPPPPPESPAPPTR